MHREFSLKRITQASPWADTSEFSVGKTAAKVNFSKILPDALYRLGGHEDKKECHHTYMEQSFPNNIGS